MISKIRRLLIRILERDFKAMLLTRLYRAEYSSAAEQHRYQRQKGRYDRLDRK